MNQAFVSGFGGGNGVLTFRGRSYPFTLTGSLIGLGAISAAQAGLTFSEGRYELYIQLPQYRRERSRGARAYPVPPGSMRKRTPSRRTKW